MILVGGGAFLVFLPPLHREGPQVLHSSPLIWFIPLSDLPNPTSNSTLAIPPRAGLFLLLPSTPVASAPTPSTPRHSQPHRVSQCWVSRRESLGLGLRGGKEFATHRKKMVLQEVEMATAKLWRLK